MPRTHTHWPDGKGPTCTFATKRECDAAFKAANKAALDAYKAKIAEAKARERERQNKAIDRFIAMEKRRMNARAIRLKP